MKKLLVTLVVLTVALLASCDDGMAFGSGKSNQFAGHYETWGWNNTWEGDTSTDAWIFDSWNNGGYTVYKQYCVNFEGDYFWMLTDDKMTGGSKFTYTDTHFTQYQGTQRYSIIDKDTIYFHYNNDDPSGISSGMSWLLSVVLKKSGRKGHMEAVQWNGTSGGYYHFVDD